MKKFTSLLMLFCMFVGTALAQLPEITTDMSNPIYYTIYNTRSSQPGGLMYFAGENVGIKDGCTSLSIEDKYKFFFTGSHDALYVHNAAAPGLKLAKIGNGNKASNEGAWTATGAEWQVITRGDGNLAFGIKGAGVNAYDWWNECNYFTNKDNNEYPDFTSWTSGDEGSAFVVEPADSHVFPETDKFYVIEAPLFFNKQGVNKGLLVNADGSLGWNTIDLTNKNCYWQIEVSEGTVALKNLGTGKYVNGTAMGDDATYGKINALGSNQFNIVINGTILHANGHNGGANPSGNIVNYAGAIGSASAWAFVEKADPDAAQEVTVEYSFTYGGEEKYAQTTATLVGEEYPAFTVALPYGVSATKPAGTIAAGDVVGGKVTKEIVLSVNLPFVAAADYASITKWYYLKFDSNNNFYLHHDADQNHIDLSSKSVDSSNKDIYSWAFVGDPFDGYQIVNKGAGADYILSSSITMAGETGADTWPIMTKLTELPVGNNTHWIPTASTHATDGFFLAQKDNTSNRLNNRGSKLAYWTGGADQGSTVVAEEVLSDEAEIQNLLNEYQAWKALRPVGSGLGQYSYDAEVFAAAEQTLNNANTLSDVEDAIEACKNLFQINIPTAGFYRVKSMNANDANKKGKYWQSKVDASGMELAAEKDDARSIIYLGEDNSVTSYGCGYALNQYAGMDAAGTAGKAWRITENAAVPATYALYRNGDGYCLSDWYGLTYGQNDANAAWMLEKVTSLPVTISAAGYATFYAPVALTLPAELTAYTVSVNGEWATLNEIVGDVIPANTGVVLQGAPETYDLTVAESAETISGNELLGTVAASYVTDDAYVLGYVGEEGNKEVGFYTANKNQQDGASWLNNGFKAYLPKPVNAARFLNFNFGTETGIGEVETEAENAVIYDLAGRRVQKAQKGLYIVNGKKVIR